MAISHDRGETWQFVSTLPLGQFYHVAVDMDAPYNVYGGLQDNGSWRGPSTDWEPRRHPQARTGTRSAAATASTPGPIRSDSMTGYSMSQGGYARCAGTCAPASAGTSARRAGRA